MNDPIEHFEGPALRQGRIKSRAEFHTLVRQTSVQEKALQSLRAIEDHRSEPPDFGRWFAFPTLKLSHLCLLIYNLDPEGLDGQTILSYGTESSLLAAYKTQPSSSDKVIQRFRDVQKHITGAIQLGTLACPSGSPPEAITMQTYVLTSSAVDFILGLPEALRTPEALGAARDHKAASEQPDTEGAKRAARLEKVPDPRQRRSYLVTIGALLNKLGINWHEHGVQTEIERITLEFGCRVSSDAIGPIVKEIDDAIKEQGGRAIGPNSA